MTKRKYVAQVGMTLIHQVEFEADETLTDDELDDLAGELAMKAVGGCDFQVLELESRREFDDGDGNVPL